MGGEAKERSTSLHLSCGLLKSPDCPNDPNGNKLDYLAMKQLSDGFFLVGKQLINLNTALANGLPMQVHITQPPAEISFNPTITCEPPMVRVEPPMVRVDNYPEAPRVDVQNNVNTPPAYFSRNEVLALVGSILMFLCILSVGIVLIGVGLWTRQ